MEAIEGWCNERRQVQQEEGATTGSVMRGVGCNKEGGAAGGGRRVQQEERGGCNSGRAV